MEFSNWPYWVNQTTDRARDGDGGAGPNAYNNCMPASLTACLLYTSGINLDPDYIWDSEGYTELGPTDYGHAQNFLQTYASTSSGLLLAFPHVIGEHIRSWLDDGHPAIARFWIDPWQNKQPAHFSPVTGYTLDASGNLSTIIRHDVANGQRQVMSYSDFKQALAVDDANTASALAVNRKRNLGR